MREPCRERGFTLIELMVVVAIVAILAAVVIPSFTREAAKTKGKTEVTAMFAEIAIKEEQYKNEVPGSAYLDAVKCPGSPTPAGYIFNSVCKTTGSSWDLLRINSPEATMRCSYTIEWGLPSVPLTPPAPFTVGPGPKDIPTEATGTMASSWFYMVGECDESGDGGTNTTFFRSSVDNKTYVVNEGS